MRTNETGGYTGADNGGAPLQWTPWGKVPANDNYHQPSRRPIPPLMIGLTGLRNVGKSTVADLLAAEYGFHKVHAFAAGKEAAERWFDAIGGDGYRMVYGDLKDQPSEHLPGGVAPRYFLERFGHFMGAEMGVTWTLGLEISNARSRYPHKPIVVESLVYEAPWFKAQGGVVWRLERPGHSGPAGVASDSVQAGIEADVTIAARSVAELTEAVRDVMGGYERMVA